MFPSFLIFPMRHLCVLGELAHNLLVQRIGIYQLRPKNLDGKCEATTTKWDYNIFIYLRENNPSPGPKRILASSAVLFPILRQIPKFMSVAILPNE